VEECGSIAARMSMEPRSASRRQFSKKINCGHCCRCAQEDVARGILNNVPHHIKLSYSSSPMDSCCSRYPESPHSPNNVQHSATVRARPSFWGK
jgi:hypothetical protein